MKTATVVNVNLAGVGGTVESSYAPFIDYATLHLKPLREESPVSPTVRAVLRWHDVPPSGERLAKSPELSDWERIDRDLYRCDGHLAWFRVDELPGLQLRFAWDGKRLSIEADYYHFLSKSVRRDRLKRAWYRGRLHQMRQGRFTTLLYYLLYYPCFWWMERQAGFHPIHAAGVEIGGRIVVLAGPSGVGKSTLAVALAASPDASFLSDTFLMQRGSTVRPIREPLLLDAWSRQWLGEAGGLLEPLTWRYCLSRKGFHWPADRLSAGGPVGLVLFPHRAREGTLERLAPGLAHGRISAGNFIINDLRRYWAYAAVLEMLDPSPLTLAREIELSALVESVPSYALGLTNDVSRDEIVSTIRGLLASQGQEPRGSQGRAAPVG